MPRDHIFFALISCLIALPPAQSSPAVTQDYPIQPVSFADVRIERGLWADRLKTNREVTIPYDFRKCEETGRISNFSKAAGLVKGEFEGIPFNDSDVYKVIEGAAYSLATFPDEKLDRYLEELIAKIAAAQEPDGYLYTARRLFPPEKMPKMSGNQRWSNLASSHELYNVGHLYEAAAAHFLATGKRSLLDVALKNADLICATFGPAPEQRKDPPGHEEIEIGLVRLFRVTGQQKYLEQARFFIDRRGRAEGRKLRGAGQQDHKPVVEQEEAVGHAVRAGYLYCGVADVAALTGQAAYVNAIDRIWSDVVERKMYLTGGIGARHAGEAFGESYELPNATAYNETCAAIANALWNHRMFLLHGESRYLDVLERAIYNGFLAGVSLKGDEFFYPNPLESDGRTRFNHGASARQPWFGCSCCPVNVVRFIPSLAGYLYATDGDALLVNLFADSTARDKLPQQTVQIVQSTAYPWDGRVRITVTPEKTARFAIRVRIPGWAQGRPVPGELYRYLDPTPAAVSLRVNGQAAGLELEKGFAVLNRPWAAGDVIQLDLAMPIRRVATHPAVKENLGRVALERGPVVYCVEGKDHSDHALNIALPDDAPLTAEHRPEFLGGLTVLRGKAIAAHRGEDGRIDSRPIELTAIPYYAWCHRGPNEMAVFVPRDVKDAKPAAAPTLASQSVATASHCFPPDSLGALNDELEPKASGDHSLPRFTWWDHRGTEEWVQYDFKTPATVRAARVYWFDDTGRGRCRVPQSWMLLCRDGEAWKPVQATGEFAVKKDQFNHLEFAPVNTSGLRLVVRLQDGFSGGILEWKVE